VKQKVSEQWTQAYGKILAIPPSAPQKAQRLRAFTVQLIRDALEEAGGSMAVAAKELGVGYSTIQRWLSPDYYWDELGDVWRDTRHEGQGRPPKK
jgi:transposase